MEVGNAPRRVLGKLKGNRGVVPNFLRETNLPFILRDPVPFFNRAIVRRAARAETPQATTRLEKSFGRNPINHRAPR